MTDLATLDAYGVLTEPTTLTIQRILPGTVERVWDYLTQSDLRRKWLAAGDMELKVGAPFELTWRNDELTDPPGARPEGFAAEHSMQSRIIALDPPRKLAFSWGTSGDVTFELEPRSNGVLLTVTHRGLTERPSRLMISAGWHAHLDILTALASNTKPAPFWDGWSKLRDDYDRLLPA